MLIEKSVQKLINDWLEYLTNAKKFAHHTINAYKTDLEIFIHFLANYHNHSINKNHFSNLSITDIRAFLAQREKENISATSRAVSYTHLTLPTIPGV